MTDTPAPGRVDSRDRVDATGSIARMTESDPTDPTGSDVSDGADDEMPDADAAAARIHDRAAEIREREVETALTKLDAQGDLSPADEAAVEAVADRLVERLIAVPERGLEAASSADGEDGEAAAVETALELFG